MDFINREDITYVKNVIKSIIGEIDNTEIKLNNIDKFGWTATIRTKNVDLLFTYYTEECWKIETFPVAMMAGSIKRSVQIF